jgi:lipoate-protein ligase A
MLASALKWFLLDSGKNDGPLNMAIDEFLATQANLEFPLLRFYQWDPFTISLGYNQRVADLELEQCQKNGIGLVRRPTGGRAVLHAEEVTYSVIIPKSASAWYSESTLATYNLISELLVAGLNRLGLAVTLEQKTGGNIAYAARTTAAIPCFSASAQYEILFDGRKLVGSAQRRFEKTVLQHGSILLDKFHLNLPAYLKIANPDDRVRLTQMLDQKTVSMAQVLNHPPTYQQVVEAISAGFKEKSHISFITKLITPGEMAGVQMLRKKYLNLWR